MSLDLLNFRVGLAGGDHVNMRTLAERQTATSCNLNAGELYLFPNSTSTVDATQPVTFRWNTACAGITPTVDLYLYSSASTGLIQAFKGLSFSEGQYTTNLLPRWWNSTTTASLQVNLMNSGGPSWYTTGPAGPIFTVTYPESQMFQTVTEGGAVKTSTAAAAMATNSGDAIIQNVTNTKTEGGIAKGAIAAAVLVPIIAIAALAAVAIRFWRQREAEKRRRWSQALSHHSAMEWEKGARAGEKDAPGGPGGRPASHAPMSIYMRGDAVRSSMATSSVYAVENNMAGAGAAGLVRPGLSGLRSVSADGTSVHSSVQLPNGEMRQSRISFAESARPDRRSRMSFGGADIRPPHPAAFKLPGAASTPRSKTAHRDDDDELNISPTQRDGPGGYTGVTGKQRTGRKSIRSFGGGDKRRESSASALSQDDFRIAASAGGSTDELRDLEKMVLARRSQISQYSANRASAYSTDNQSPVLPYGQHANANQSQYSLNPSTPREEDTDRMEDLSHSDSAPSVADYFKPLPSPASSTVAYGPDQMLAVYAARAANAASPAIPASAPAPANAGSVSKKGGIKILTSFGRKETDDAHSSSPKDISAPSPLPIPVPSPSLRVPPMVMTRQRSGTVGRGGQPGQGDDAPAHAQ